VGISVKRKVHFTFPSFLLCEHGRTRSTTKRSGRFQDCWYTSAFPLIGLANIDDNDDNADGGVNWRESIVGPSM
jgi:hypothetical protein